MRDCIHCGARRAVPPEFEYDICFACLEQDLVAVAGRDVSVRCVQCGAVTEEDSDYGLCPACVAKEIGEFCARCRTPKINIGDVLACVDCDMWL